MQALTSYLSAKAPVPARLSSPPAVAPEAPTDVATLGERHTYELVPGLPHIAATTASVEETGVPAQKAALVEELTSHMRAYPSLRTVIAVVPQEDGLSTSLVVVGRPDAVQQSQLDGPFEVTARLAGSSLIKSMGASYPHETHQILPIDQAKSSVEIRLPGHLRLPDLEVALTQAHPNDDALVKQLVDDLPKGRRVGLLLDGPSAAGKSTFIKKIQEFAGDRKVTVINGDMYFKDHDDPSYPKTASGNFYWDSIDAMDLQRQRTDFAQLLQTGQADLPVYNFNDEKPGGYKIPVSSPGFREEKPRHVEVGSDDIIVLDSIHAGNPAIVRQLEEMPLPYRMVYMDAPRAEDRLVRRIVRDFTDRGGIPAKEQVALWDETTWPGEVNFVRPSMLNMNPSDDVFLTLQFPNDLGITRSELEKRNALLEEWGLQPTYPAYKTPEDQLGAFALTEEKRLQGVLDDAKATPAQKSLAQKGLASLYASPHWQKA